MAGAGAAKEADLAPGDNKRGMSKMSKKVSRTTSRKSRKSSRS